MREREREREKEGKREKEWVREINHVSIHQWFRSAIPDSQQPTSPIGFLFKRLRATAGQGPNYVGPSCGYMLAYVGLSCGQRGPILWLCWPMFASCWPMLSHKIRKMGAAKKRCKTQDILMVGGLSWGYVGPSWGYVGPSWGQCGPSLGLCWPILELCWPILGLCWPILGLCWPMLGLCWPILIPMLAHVDPPWATGSEKWEKEGRAKYPVKRMIFWRGGVGLSHTERRETPSATPRPEGPWPDFWNFRHRLVRHYW